MLLRLSSLFLLVLLCFACGQENERKADTPELNEPKEVTFDQVKWSTKKGLDYPHQESMYQDVLYSDEIRQMNEGEVLKLLGKPDRVNENHIYYQISQRRLGIWPLHTRALVIKFDVNKKVEWIKMNE